MGLLRFAPALMDVFIRDRRSHLLQNEFIVGEDGKYRYPKRQRIGIYKMLYELFKAKEADLFVYLCMERSDVWKQVTGQTMDSSNDLFDRFDERIEQFYRGAA